MRTGTLSLAAMLRVATVRAATVRAISLALLATAAGCRTPETAEAPDPVVARGSGVEVRQSAFADEYRRFASLAPVADGLQARRDYARLMLERAFVAEAARRTGHEEDPVVRAHVRRARGFAMRQRYLVDSLEARITEPTEADVQEAFRRQNTCVRVRQAFAPTEAAARALAARARAGEPFGSIARASMRAVGLDATGEMGCVSFNDLDEAPENTVFALDSGAVSAPVASLRGWHVFQSLGREETVRLDATAYASARERLAFDLRQRRLEEAGARMVRPLLEAHALAIQTGPLRALWPAIAPLVPARGEAAVLARAREELPVLRLESLSRSTPVATVDGVPFTVGQLLDQMPDIPVEFWTPDLRQAVEVAIRDSILTARAQAAGAADAPDVGRAVREARATALYYAGLKAVVDTVQLDRHVGTFYREWRSQFVTARTTTYTAWTFPSADAARTALSRAQAGEDWDALSARVPSAVRTATAAPGEAGPFGVHTLPLVSGPRRALTGPFPDGNAAVVVEAMRRTRTVAPLGTVRGDVLAAMQADPRVVAHRLLLDTGFDSAAVTFDDAALLAAVPAATPESAHDAASSTPFVSQSRPRP